MYRKVLKYISIVCAVITLAPSGSLALDHVCDESLYTQMVNNARLAAERKMFMANTLIRKPDSVLEYSCYDQLAKIAARSLSRTFSQTENWKGSDGESYELPIDARYGDDAELKEKTSISVYTSEDLMDRKIEELVLTTIKDFTDNAFTHTFLGGHVPETDSGTGSNNNLGTTLEDGEDGVQNVCDHMRIIDEIARCEDFAPGRDFTTYAQWAELDDPRTMPVACPSKHIITAELVAQADNADFTEAPREDVQTYNDYIGADLDAGSGSTCDVEPIPTGIIVQYRRYSQDISGNPTVAESYDYEEKICPSPGCYFDNRNDSSSSNDRCRQ